MPRTNNFRNARRVPRGPDKRGIEGRLFEKRLINGECWIWLGATIKNKIHEYGVIYYDGKEELVHRVSASLFLGFDLKSSLQVNHKQECKDTRCFNPGHLYVGSQTDNMNDFWTKRKQDAKSNNS